jgi:pilus assembly protein FimV
MAYNKSKIVESAQKLLNQGKVTQAIAEYQHILKTEPRDQVTLMTIGELYIRQGETFQAIDYFERLAQIFVGDGFLTKAIAVYKRIAKLAPEEIRPLEKLADLYVQQGVMSEARPLFLQLAEIHLKNNRQPEAVGLLKKLLMAEPDNIRIQVRLADLYHAMGQSRDAVEAYVSAAQRALARGEHSESEKLADRALKIDPNCQAATIVKARSFSSQGNASQAAQLLEHVSDLEKGGEQAELLLDLHAKNADWDKATALALRVLGADDKNFGPAQKVVEGLLETGQTERAMGILAQIRVPMIDAGEHEVIGRLQNDLVQRMPGRIEPLEWLVDFYGRTSDSFRLPDALSQLGDALVASNQLDRAKAIFEQLIDRQPDKDSAKRKLDNVLRKMGLLASEEVSAVPISPVTAEAPKPPVPKVHSEAEAFTIRGERPDAATPSPEPALDDETQKFIVQSLTDVDLFASYGLTQKAIGLLEAILRRAPRHTTTLEKLLDFVLGAGDDRRTAELAAQLEQIHFGRGDHRSAERFGELRRRFQRAAGLTDEEIAAAAAPPAQTPEAFAVEPTLAEVGGELPGPETVEVAPSSASPAVQEVDLSDEWASMLEDTHPAEPGAKQPPARPPEPATPEVRATPIKSEEFAVPTQPVVPAPQDSSVTEFAIPVESPAAGEEMWPPAQVPLQHPPITKPQVPAATVQNRAPEPVDKSPVQKKHPVEEPEFELEQDYELVLEPESLVPAYDQKPPDTPLPVRPPVEEPAAVPSATETFASDQFLADLVNEIDQLGLDALVPSRSEPARPPTPPRKEEPVAPLAEPSPLKEVFDEFRAELGEMGSEDEDLETHYNLGVAFREMGLLDEAISEFQKVAKGSDHGKPFRYGMQCCTLLGLAFMEKGQPGIAAIWYERALQTPGIEPESILALRYDLGVAQESAGEPEAALKSFSQVYAMNIDYRDVADRIAALQKPIR